MKVIAAALAACALFCGSAQAQTVVMKDFSLADMRSAMTEAGATVAKEEVTAGGDRYLSATSSTGMNFGVYAYECDTPAANQRCRGADLVVTFSVKADKMQQAQDAVSYAAVADYAVDTDSLQMSRYVIFDDGITRANLIANLTVFMDLTDESWGKLTDAGYLR